MEEVAQGRVWSGKDAASRGLIDAIGGFSRAVAIAKHRANIPQDSQVSNFFLDFHYFYSIINFDLGQLVLEMAYFSKI